jgi:hypothetical protein
LFCYLINYGGESGKVNKLRQLVDIIPVSFSPIGEDPVQLRVLRVENKLSLRQLSKATGHSISYLQSQLRKFGIDQEKGNLGVAPYGWDWTGSRLVKNAQEQMTICEMTRLHEGGRSLSAIALDLNRRSIPAKNGGQWWPVTVGKVIRRVSRAGKDSGS